MLKTKYYLLLFIFLLLGRNAFANSESENYQFDFDSLYSRFQLYESDSYTVEGGSIAIEGLGISANYRVSGIGFEDEAEPICGDGILNNSEACDTADFGGKSCADFGYNAGLLVCDNCQIKTTNCYSQHSSGSGGPTVVAPEEEVTPDERPIDEIIPNPDDIVYHFGEGEAEPYVPDKNEPSRQIEQMKVVKTDSSQTIDLEDFKKVGVIIQKAGNRLSANLLPQINYDLLHQSPSVEESPILSDYKILPFVLVLLILLGIFFYIYFQINKKALIFLNSDNLKVAQDQTFTDLFWQKEKINSNRYVFEYDQLMPNKIKVLKEGRFRIYYQIDFSSEKDTLLLAIIKLNNQVVIESYQKGHKNEENMIILNLNKDDEIGLEIVVNSLSKSQVIINKAQLLMEKED